jgi:murein DD-endopeptidase MepM/ murein hydrolase activator NlpD
MHPTMQPATRSERASTPYACLALAMVSAIVARDARADVSNAGDTSSAIETVDARREPRVPVESPTDSTAPTLDEATLLARVPSFDVRAQVPRFWSSEGFWHRPLEPDRQRARMPRQCRTTGGYRAHCSGPRLVPAPSGAAAALAQRLGLGSHEAALQILGPSGPFDAWRDAVRDLDREPRLTYPVPAGRTGCGFGYVRGGSLRRVRHDGVDIQAARGAAIVSARGGLVAYADNGISGMGNLLVILHAGGDSTTYAHCERIHVQAGQLVARGEHVADVGDTGFARAPHLHFQWRENGRNRDPRRMLLPRPER